jgi:hypothetical protein
MTTYRLLKAERRNIQAGGERFRLVRAEYGLRQLDDQRPYFTVTGEAWAPGNNRRSDPDVCGCIHDIVGEIFPDLHDLIRLHLSDVDGVPMHAHANGWYWFSDYDGRGGTTPPADWQGLTGAQRAERYLRAPAGHFDGVSTREQFDARVETLREQWRGEAGAIIDRHVLTSV